jgi:hypothetical protein
MLRGFPYRRDLALDRAVQDQQVYLTTGNHGVRSNFAAEYKECTFQPKPVRISPYSNHSTNGVLDIVIVEIHLRDTFFVGE